MRRMVSTGLLLLVLAAGSLNAWDGERKGFLLGIGFGAGYDLYTGIRYDSIGPDREENASFAFAASPRIGYAFNNQMALLYGRHPLTFTVPDENGDDIRVTVCTEALQFNSISGSRRLPAMSVSGRVWATSSTRRPSTNRE